MDKKDLSRRQFLRKGAFGAVGAGLMLTSLSRPEAQTTSLIPAQVDPGEPLKIGIVGCGNRSKSHIQSLNNIPEIQIAALCDVVPHKMDRRRELIKRNHEIKQYTDMEQMVRLEDLDGVAVVLPNHLHKEATIMALQAGKHVFCEKPMALTVADCNAMIATVERTRQALQIGTQRRHSTGVKVALQQIRQAPLGRILSSDIQSYRRDWRVPADDEYPPGKSYWRMDQEKCGGVVYEMGAHIIDLNNWIFDSEPIKVISLQGVNNLSLRKRNSTDHGGVMVRYANNAMMNYGGNLYNYGGQQVNCFFAVHGTIELSDSHLQISYGQPRGFPAPGTVPETVQTNLPDMDGTYQQWVHFARVMSGESEPYPDGYIGRQTIQICEGAVRSSTEGMAVQVNDLG